jgi:hypothetical protein
MNLTATLICLAGAGAIAAVAGWMGARPFDPRRGPRMVPWRIIMVAATVWGLLMLVHLANLSGVATGR